MYIVTKLNLCHKTKKLNNISETVLIETRKKHKQNVSMSNSPQQKLLNFNQQQTNNMKLLNERVS